MKPIVARVKGVMSGDPICLDAREAFEKLRRAVSHSATGCASTVSASAAPGPPASASPTITSGGSRSVSTMTSAPFFKSLPEREASSPGFRAINPTISSRGSSSPTFSAGTFSCPRLPLGVAPGALNPR